MKDLKAGLYLPLPDAKPCDRLCANRTNCCDDLATCSCGTDTGHYGCVCPPGYYGSGLAGTCKPCPTGTYSEGSVPGDLSLCLPCPDANHITPLTATRQSQCLCKKGFVAQGDECQGKATKPLKGGGSKEGKVGEHYRLKGEGRSEAHVEGRSIFSKLRRRRKWLVAGRPRGPAISGLARRRHTFTRLVVFGESGGRWSNSEWSHVKLTCTPVTSIPTCGSKSRLMFPHSPPERAMSSPVISCRKLSPPVNGYFVKSSCGNVLNAACGVRCHVGYRLSGSSIRLCQEDGTWSGEDAECVVKTCSPPPAPLNGDMNCSSPDLVVDTECKFSCEQGHLLVGSRTRSCLPVSRWDGLKTICKPLHCPPLPKLNHGLITPRECTTTKQLYGTRCNVSCSDGFALRGPRTRNCGGKAGTWSGRNFINKCVDVTPPVLKCPSDITISNDLNEDYATVSWTVPNSTDNSGHASSLRSEPSVVPPLKIKVGITTIKYTATDASKNKAHCNFTIKVEDREPPEVDHCEAPPPFLSGTELTQLSWDPPLFHDNSGQPVKVTRVPDTDMFPYGDTEVLYVATDEWNNNSTCVFNVTVEENVCQEPSDPLHGHSNCTLHPDSLHCILTCLEGYAFAVQPRDFFCTYDETGSVLTPDKDVDPFPDCSVTVLPNTITQDSIITLDGEETLCQDPGFLSQLEAHMKAHIVKKLSEICGNGDLVCQVGDMKAACDQILSSLEEESNSVARRRRRQINNNLETSLNASSDMATTYSATNFTEDSRNSTDVQVPTTESNTNNLTNTINVNFQLIGSSGSPGPNIYTEIPLTHKSVTV
uniref:Sushi, von Willebrand factor type A, EGF and pentraxin domain-containing protein 1 n=1 Tax=Timema shepardi TaxID=629360 RepID=A0A7R9AK11_TIMSH|nr:unnamed protein product [Timema shepardi]